jgi:hypothetical protein
MTNLVFATDDNLRNAYAPVISNNCVNVTLASQSEHRTIVPNLGSNVKHIAAFSYPSGGPVWVSINNVASAPGSSFASTTSEGMPAQLTVNPGDSISCYNNSSNALDIGISFYTGPL